MAHECYRESGCVFPLCFPSHFLALSEEMHVLCSDHLCLNDFTFPTLVYSQDLISKNKAPIINSPIFCSTLLPFAGNTFWNIVSGRHIWFWTSGSSFLQILSWVTKPYALLLSPSRVGSPWLLDQNDETMFDRVSSTVASTIDGLDRSVNRLVLMQCAKDCITKGLSSLGTSCSHVLCRSVCQINWFHSFMDLCLFSSVSFFSPLSWSYFSTLSWKMKSINTLIKSKLNPANMISNVIINFIHDYFPTWMNLNIDPLFKIRNSIRN